MNLDYRKLKGRIKEAYDTQVAFATAMGVSNNTMTAKLDGSSDWKQSEILRACRLLHIGVAFIPDFFFSAPGGK